jgi:hypothetical protein
MEGSRQVVSCIGDRNWCRCIRYDAVDIDAAIDAELLDKEESK